MTKAPEHAAGNVATVPYGSARALIRSGDRLFFASRSPCGRAIQAAGRGPYSHVAMAVWWGRPAELRPENDENGILLACETRGWHGGRLVPMSDVVAEHAGWIDVYGINTRMYPDYDRWGAVEWALRNMPGVRYGYGTFLRIALHHLPIVRWFVPISIDDLQRPGGRAVCSTALAMADRLGGGVDPVPNLPDDRCEPADLARSALYVRKFRLRSNDSPA